MISPRLWPCHGLKIGNGGAARRGRRKKSSPTKRAIVAATCPCDVSTLSRTPSGRVGAHRGDPDVLGVVDVLAVIGPVVASRPAAVVGGDDQRGSISILGKFLERRPELAQEAVGVIGRVEDTGRSGACPTRRSRPARRKVRRSWRLRCSAPPRRSSPGRTYCRASTRQPGHPPVGCLFAGISCDSSIGAQPACTFNPFWLLRKM